MFQKFYVAISFMAANSLRTEPLNLSDSLTGVLIQGCQQISFVGACLCKLNQSDMLSNSEGVPCILFAQATKGNQSKSFYTMPEYESWCEGVNTSGWKIKYYKGLGTSTDEEAQEYFADIDRHRKRFVWNGKP